MSMSYAGAGVVAPAGGTPADYVFFKATFDHIFGQYNAALTRMNTYLPSASAPAVATPNSTPGTLMLRGATLGEANAGYFAVNPAVASTATAHQIVLPGGHTGLAWYVSLAAAMTSQMDAFGNLTMGGRLKAGSGGLFVTTIDGHLDATALAGLVPATNGGTGVASPAAGGLLVANGAAAMATVAPGAAGNVLQSVAGAWASAAFAIPATTTLPYTQVADYKPAANASAGVVTVGAGAAYTDSGGNQVGPLAQQTATLPAQPSGTNIQYVALSLAPITGAPVATAGSAGASPARPTVPSGNAPVAMVTWRGATTLPSGVVAAADIVDLRLPGGFGAGAAGGGGGLPTTTAFVSNGDLRGTYANSLPLSLAAASVAGSTTAGSAALADFWTIYQQPDIATRLSVAGATVTLSAGSGVYTGPGGPNFTVAFGGVARKVTAAATATASGAGGQRTLVMDANPANPLLSLMAIVTLSSTQYPIAYYAWDGANLYDNGGGAFKTMAQGVASPAVLINMKVSTQTADQASATYTASAAAGMPDDGFANGATADVRLSFRVRASITTTGAGASFEAVGVIDGATVLECDDGVAIPSTVTSPTTLEVWLKSAGWSRSVPVSATGSHSFGLRYTTANCTVVLHSRTITAEVWG